ncbi:hypothetical protein SAE01_32450 [Segetibacter aerophilus]|uniref:Uncharacterized protein n=1 Tax=Segetibacter aerophilus TaxID=670293 RepID=A0A512BFK7_9BACT|nr:hypothetical protein SAE01_32450 [Segetibacter aerophilus]
MLVKNERILLKKLKTCCPKAFNDLYDCYAAPLCGLILNDVLAVDEACRILTEVFTKFNKNLMLGKDAEVGIFISLVRIAKKLAIDSKKI